MMTDLTMKEIVKLSWDAMNEEERKLHTDVQHIKRMCMSRVEDLFVQHYHDTGIDDLPKLVEECRSAKQVNIKSGKKCRAVVDGTRDIDFFIDNIIYDLVKTEQIRLRDEDREDREKMKRLRDVE